MIVKNLFTIACNQYTKQRTIEELITCFNKYLPEYEITTPQRECAFIAQASIETGAFNFFRELGGKKYFLKYEPDTDKGKKVGNIYFGDGFNFRGRGIFQLTGRFNYKKYGEIIGKDLISNPSLAEDPVIATRLACEYWKDHKLSPLADAMEIDLITRRINGGLTKADERKELFNNLLEFYKKAA